MNNSVPQNPEIYHIVHIDRLVSILSEAHLWSDASVQDKKLTGTMIGMSDIKKRRLSENKLQSHQDLFVGQCVPFYFCPRSVMLYIISCANHPQITYRGGQKSIIHLQADFNSTIQWANQNKKRWAFTNSNAGSGYFDDYNNLSDLSEINWDAVNALDWKSCQDKKQAEFLIEEKFPCSLIKQIGVFSPSQKQEVEEILQASTCQPLVLVKNEWYY